MEDTKIIESINEIAPIINSLATVGLCLLTGALVWATNKLANYSNHANVAVSLEPNIWTLLHFDLVLNNSGNAPAYNTHISVKSENDLEKELSPITHLSILPPNQQIKCYLNSYKNIENDIFIVSISWSKNPRKIAKEKLEYRINMKSFNQLNQLGKKSSSVAAAASLKKLEDVLSRELSKIANTLSNLQK